MKRRLNYTGRRRITRDKILIRLDQKEGVVKSFSAKLDLADLQLMEDAKVYVIGYHGTDQKRFGFGTVGEMIIPRNTSLEDLAYTENLRFRVLVVDERNGQGLILAQADRITPFPKSQNKSILPVDFRDLGQQTWNIEYTEDEGGPLLVLNSRIPNIQTLAKSDRLFSFFVYPSVIREVLNHIIFVEGGDSVIDPSVQWHGDWLNFAVRILGGEAPPAKSLDRNTEDEEKWIDKVVEEFCNSRRGWVQFLNKLSGSEMS